MKNLTLIASLFVSIQLSFAQFSIGSKTITYNDPNRTGGVGSGAGPGRQIECAVYYPATSAGANTPVAEGQFPIVVFGHGFAMEWTAYQNIWQHLVPQGFIIIFPKTESGFFPAPSHGDFGLDLALVSDKLLAENNETTSSFFQKINGNSAIMGHSMGGGATILAAQGNNNIKTIIGLAPAETNPSAITAAENITVPALVLSGSSDGVSPPAQHHIPIYDGLSSACKSFVNIVGGAHCYFASTNVPCDFGESTSSTGITLTRTQQQAFMNSLITPWLNYYLKNECLAYSQFYNAASSSGLFHTQNCTTNPLTVDINITNATNNQSNGSATVAVTGGPAFYTLIWSNGSSTLTNVPPGSYTLTYSDATCSGTITITVGNNTVITGISEDALNATFIYPNPTQGESVVLSDFTQKFDILIVDAAGRTVFQDSNITLNQYEIPTTELGTGVYMIHFRGESSQFSKRLVKM
jgi:predicted dienelactone hydrolase